MFDTRAATTTTAQLRTSVGALARLDVDVPEAELIDQLRLLEELKAAAAAAQARVTTAFVTGHEESQRLAGVRDREIGKGVAAQVALAKRESPARASRYVGWSRVLTTELPATYAALAAGRITEWRAQIVARDTMWLSAEQRRQVDEEIAAHIEGWGDRRVEAEVRRVAYRLDPKGFVERSAGRAKDRTVTVRPAPETMSYLTGYLPVAQGVAVYTTLKATADSLRSQGDERSRSQIMADLLVERITGQQSADSIPVEVSVVMTDQALFNTGPGAQEPAHLEGFGPVPAELARRMVLAADAAAEVWLRRFYTHPESGQLAGMDSRRRLFGGALRKLLVVRDQWCRTPWCDAPIRHVDHVTAAAGGGETSVVNGQGLCEGCNHAKEAPGWRARASGGDHEARHEVVISTPTGHVYRSKPPDPPGARQPRGRPPSTLETHYRGLVGAA